MKFVFLIWNMHKLDIFTHLLIIGRPFPVPTFFLGLKLGVALGLGLELRLRLGLELQYVWLALVYEIWFHLIRIRL